MRIRTVVIVTSLLIVCITVANFFSDTSIAPKLPESRIELARREVLEKPFLERQHRLERKARLEKLFDTPPRPTAKKASKAELGSSMTSQRLQKTNLETALEETKRAKYHVIPSVDGGLYTGAACIDLKPPKSAQSHDIQSPAQQIVCSSKALNICGFFNRVLLQDSLRISLPKEWQVRVCYYWYRKMKAIYPDSPMGGFTRLLHSGKPDNLTDEIPTAVVDPLPPGVDQGYIVLNRPYAFLQWVKNFLPSIPEDYIFMAEPDHLFVRPPPLWATPSKAAAYPFTYITPQKNAHLLNRFNEKNVSATMMAPIGNAPVQIHRRQFEGIVEKWHNISLRMKKDPEVDKAFGWILEMYAFSISSSQADEGPIIYDLHRELMAQPPFDPYLEIESRPTCIVHLTYGMDYDRQGTMKYGEKGDFFHWDKRDYTYSYPPRNLSLPKPPVQAPAVDFLISAINEASANLPWPV